MSFQNIQGVKQEPHSILGTGRTTVSGNNVPTQLTTDDIKCMGVYVSADPSAGKHFALQYRG